MLMLMLITFLIAQVRAHDWRTALSRAPKPCSLRSALPICHAPLAHVPQNASPAFLRCLVHLLGHAHRCLVPMAPAVQPLAQSAAKLDAAWAGGPTGISEAEQLQQKFEGQLTEALQAVSMPSLAAGSQRDAEDAEDGAKHLQRQCFIADDVGLALHASKACGGA